MTGRILMAWDRICELSVGSSGQGLLVSALDVDFEVERSLTYADNNATFTIYNAKEETRKNILTVGNNIIFKAGYEDETVGVIFAGNIREATTSKSQTDWITKIFATSARGTGGKLVSEYISLSFDAEVNVQRIIKKLAALLGLVVYGISNINVTLPNGWNYVGNIGCAFRYLEEILKSNDCGLYKDNDELVIYKIGENSKFEVVNLGYKGGLLNLENITDKESDTRTRFKFESLIIPQCQVNGLVRIDTPDVVGTFTVEKLNYRGNNYGGDFNMTGEIFA